MSLWWLRNLESLVYRALRIEMLPQRGKSFNKGVLTSSNTYSFYGLIWDYTISTQVWNSPDPFKFFLNPGWRRKIWDCCLLASWPCNKAHTFIKTWCHSIGCCGCWPLNLCLVTDWLESYKPLLKISFSLNVQINSYRAPSCKNKQISLLIWCITW